MKTIMLSMFPVFLFFCVNAQNKIFDASLIPEVLKKNAYSVVREERIAFEVKAIDKATYKVHKVVTVLTENGKDELVFHEFADQFRSLESTSIQLFDRKGFHLQKFKRSDLLKQTAGEGWVPEGKVY